MTLTTACQELREWIATTAGVESASIDDHTPLFGSALLKSSHIPELLLCIEELSEHAISLDNLDTGAIHDLRTIQRTFFDGAG